MPCYHFRIKSDKKKDGARVSASTHATYIDREGKYADYDEKNLDRLQYDNVITGEHPIEHLPRRELILYKSPFGCIKQDDSGIRISDNASTETVAIAMMVAKNLYGNELSVKGSPRFEKKMVTAACVMETPIRFQEPELEAAFQNQREEEIRERRNFERAGGTIRDIRHGNFGGDDGGTSSVFQSGTPRRTLADLAKERLRLPALSERHLVRHGRNASMLLHGDEVRDVLDRRRERTARVRWDGGRARKLSVEKMARDIMVNVQQRSDTIFASSHVQYINRESAFKQRGGCVFTAHHLPKWAKDDPKIFFDAADRFERVNGERYKEIEFSLPNELDLSEQKKIIDRFIDRHLKGYYYAYAVHDKIGTMSNGERHPHVHLMFSTRRIDAYEKIHEREPELFFKRANKKDPSKGGCAKGKEWTSKYRINHTILLRKNFAEIQNSVLAENGIALRVDHRSLKARREEAAAEGNYLLAELLTRAEETPVGPTELLKKDSALVRRQKALRALNHRHEKNVLVRGILRDEINETNIQAKLEELPAWLSDIKKSIPEIEDADERERMQKEWERLTRFVQKSSLMNQAVLWSGQVLEKAKLDAMTRPEREIWQRFKANGGERQNWQAFLKRLAPLKDRPQEEMQRHEELKAEIRKEIGRLDNLLRKDSEILRPVFQRLNQPSARRNAQEQIAVILTDGYPAKQRILQDLAQTEREMKKLDASIRQTLAKENELRQYTIPELSKTLQGSMEEKMQRLKTLQRELSELGKKVISEKRALAMAENQYVQGAWRKYREDVRELKKTEKHLPEDERTRQWNELDARKVALEKQCSTAEAKEKIAAIAAGILRKNTPYRTRYQKLEAQVNELRVDIQRDDNLIHDLDFHPDATDGARYKMLAPKSGGASGGGMTYPTPDYNAHQLAHAITQPEDLGIVNLVAKSKPDAPDEWSLMSEAEKDDLKNDTASLERY